jgi:hypothetical protein
LPTPDQEYILEVIETTLSETLRPLRGTAADGRYPAAEPRRILSRRVPSERPRFDDALPAAPLQHPAAPGYS